MAVNELSSKEFIYSALKDNPFQGVLAIDTRGIVFFCNDFFFEHFGG